jgi:hypothetical protein
MNVTWQEKTKYMNTKWGEKKFTYTFQQWNNPTLHNKMVTGDETWVSQYHIETKFQNIQWENPESLRQ